MTCPDWRTLCQQRDAHQGDVPGWHAALLHLDECPDCRQRAPAVDPTLLFRRLPALVAGPGEIEAIRRTVAMRRGSVRRGSRVTVRRSLLSAAALAAVVLGSLLLRGAVAPPVEVPKLIPTLAAPAFGSDLELHQMPLVEPIDPAYGSIIQVVDDDISLVVVLLADIDVPAGTDVDV